MSLRICGCLSKRCFGSMETFGYFSANLTDLHNSEIEFLKFDERGKFLIQRILSNNADTLKESDIYPHWWAH